MVIWKGKDFKDLGIIVEFTPKLSKPKKRITQYTVPGRNGFLSVDEGTYEAFPVEVECHAKEEADYDKICSFLDGYGTLSFDGKREYTAIINNSIPFEKVQMFKKFVVSFLVNPISEDIEETTDKLLNISEYTITGATFDIYPTLEIDCIGNVSITINNKTFHLKDTDGIYILDSKNQIITHNGLNASKNMLGEFPILKNKNIIEYLGNVSDINVTYRKAYL